MGLEPDGPVRDERAADEQAPDERPAADQRDVLVSAPMPDGAPEPEAIVEALVAGGVRVRGFGVEHPSLEERFVALTGEGFDVAR
jgi:ABC-2 type transport system ATP-binding protein